MPLGKHAVMATMLFFRTSNVISLEDATNKMVEAPSAFVAYSGNGQVSVSPSESSVALFSPTGDSQKRFRKSFPKVFLFVVK